MTPADIVAAAKKKWPDRDITYSEEHYVAVEYLCEASVVYRLGATSPHGFPVASITLSAPTLGLLAGEIEKI